MSDENEVSLNVRLTGDQPVTEKEKAEGEEEDKNWYKPASASETVMSCIVFVAFILAIAAYVLWDAPLWKTSVRVSEHLSHLPEIFKYYFWLFSGPLYEVYPFLPGLLFMAAPRKDSALRFFFLFMLSYMIRNYVRAVVMEGRPIYGDSNRIVQHAECSCSFGFPSGHSEGAATAYGIAIYELVILVRKYRPRTKVLWSVAGAFVVANVMASRLYYGQHSIPQVLIGALMGLSFISIGILFEHRLVPFFRRILDGDFKPTAVVSLVMLAFLIGNAISWSFYFEDAMTSFDRYSSIRCNKCFENNLRSFKRGSVMGFQYAGYGLGYFFGIFFLKGSYSGENHHVIKEHLSWTGMCRLLTMAVCHMPLILFYFLAGMLLADTYQLMYLAMLAFTLTGFTATYAFTLLTRRFNLALHGDVTPPVQ